MEENPFSGMDKDASRIAYLISGYITDSLTENEHDELDDWINLDDRNMKLFEDLTDERNIEANLKWISEINAGERFENVIEVINEDRESGTTKWRKLWVAAAAVLIIGGLFFIYKQQSSNGKIVSQPGKVAALLPGGTRATLKTSDGKIIDLSSLNPGERIVAHGTEFTLDSTGIISYSKVSSDAESGFNTLITPVGGQFTVKLPDGTQVWINSSSSLTYPVSFSGNNRKVELSGEGYFEVAKDVHHPFLVKMSDSTTVSVLGTHFNILAYEDETFKRVTLLEGKVAVNSLGSELILEPGTQARIDHSKLSKESNVDLNEVIGWKNGLFVFHDAPIETIMRQVSRWYGARVEYKANINQLFNGSISRKEPLSRLLHLLESNGFVHFKIENDMIYVLP